MKEQDERIERLLECYFDARTTEAEERMRRYETRSAAGRGARGGRKLPPLWGVAAAAAVVLGVFFYAEYLRKPYCYIDGVAIYDKEAAMQATVYLQGLSDFGDQVRMVDELIINE